MIIVLGLIEISVLTWGSPKACACFLMAGRGPSAPAGVLFVLLGAWNSRLFCHVWLRDGRRFVSLAMSLAPAVQGAMEHRSQATEGEGLNS